jgi:hypothetical protein
VLMYEWIARVHPFQAASSLAMLARVVESNPEPLAARAGVPRFVADIVDRCLKKLPAERFASGAELLDAVERPGSTGRYAGSSTWWRVHQLAVMTLYVVATARAWQIKQWWVHSPVSLWAFVLMGIAASVGGIVRSHLIFTDVVNRGHLAAERRRSRRLTLVADLAMAAILGFDAFLLAPTQALAAVYTICVATGIALAATVMEPATTAAVFGDR